MADDPIVAATVNAIRAMGNNLARLKPAGECRYRWHAGPLALSNVAVFALIETGEAHLLAFDTAIIAAQPGSSGEQFHGGIDG